MVGKIQVGDIVRVDSRSIGFTRPGLAVCVVTAVSVFGLTVTGSFAPDGRQVSQLAVADKIGRQVDGRTEIF